MTKDLKDSKGFSPKEVVVPEDLMKQLGILAQQVGKALQAKKWLLVLAESCTGGQLAEVITTVPGCSAWFERGFVTYSNESKIEMLGVRKETIEKAGAVSEAAAHEMAEGALLRSHAQISISVTGVAGPDGGTPAKPVGTVCFGFAGDAIKTLTKTTLFLGDRVLIRMQSVRYALEELLHLMK